MMDKECRDCCIDKRKNTRQDYEEMGGILIIILGLYFLFKQFNLIPSLSIPDTLSYGLILLIGIVAAFSTCTAVTGSLLLGISTRHNEKNPNLTSYQKFKPHIYFNIGRILSYAILGGSLGVIGASLTLSTKFTSVLTIIVSIIMVILGLQLLNIVSFSFRMPQFISNKIFNASKSSNTKLGSFLFGASTFFLPCGFTQALQLYVLTKGSFVIGAITMGLFSLGTLPALVSIGAISSFSRGNFKHYLTRFSGVAIILVGLLSLKAGLALTGAVTFTDTENIVQEGEKQVVNMQVNGLDYYPKSFTIKKGVPVEWVIDGKQASGCAQILAVPSLGITQKLSVSDATVIKFTPQQTGKIRFTCGMGMAGPGEFIVI